MEINIARVFLILFACFMGIVGILINYIEPYMPIALTRLYRYGKFSAKNHQAVVAKLEVPKQWFQHFYAVAAPLMACTLSLVFYKYLFNGNPPEFVHRYLDFFMGANRRALVSPEDTFVASVLFAIIVSKRLYESYFVSIFSPSKMNITHYMVGILHYVFSIMSLIGESEGFVKGSEKPLLWSKLTLQHLICAIIILSACCLQHQANCILRDLRKKKDGTVNYTVYKIPYGGLFDYTSGALQCTEITIYVTLSIILWQASTFHYVTIWVISNQVETAILTHRWYHQTFKNYPKNRTNLIPFLF